MAGVFFFGTFEHSIDERGRVAIPARYRHAFVDGGVLRVGPEGAVEMYTPATFDEEVERRLGSENGNRSVDARRIRRGFLSDAYAVELDKQGRILIPPQVRAESDVSGRILIIGCGDYLEIWHPEKWAGEREALVQSAEGSA
ncbi:MAG: cell division/cell wall cluster transcriptional repressor MraZ [Chloroflexi bacterium]|nr:cell division/cell wall cluster transcriptional repressor MraZ [Chloroflexota bacterium]